MKLISKKLGIIGGGQLALMLTLRARQMGIEVTVLSKNKFDPAASLANNWIQGSIYDINPLKKLLAQSDRVTFESEFVPAHTLNNLNKKLKTKIFPHQNHLAILQDRWSQKELLWDFDIKTPEFIKLTGKEDLESSYQVFHEELVIKKRLGGLDGLETFIIQNKNNFNFFKRNHLNQETQYIAEQFIHFKNEMTFICCRSQKGQITHYPLFHSEHKNKQCYRVWGPVQHPQFNDLKRKIFHLLNSINYIGLISFELFNTGSELLVNEVVPRVHISGQITTDAFNIDQCELHLRAIFEINLPQALEAQNKYLMQNIIGKSHRKPHLLSSLNGKMYWYDKSKNRPQRKLGHINYIGRSFSALNELADLDLRKLIT